MNIGIVLQCRSQSKRLPRKIYAPFNSGKNSIQCILEGMKQTVVANKIILAMPKEDAKEITEKVYAGELAPYTDSRFDVFIGAGDQNNLVDRFYGAMQKHSLDIVVRLTGDCPMWIGGYKIIDEMLMEYLKTKQGGFMGNNLLVAANPYPNGIDAEVFDYELMCWTKLHAKTDYELEHCVPLMYSDLSPFPIRGFNNNKPHTMISKRISDFSMDTEADYGVIKHMMDLWDEYHDLNKVIENCKMEFLNDKTNMGKNFKV